MQPLDMLVVVQKREGCARGGHGHEHRRAGDADGSVQGNKALQEQVDGQPDGGKLLAQTLLPVTPGEQASHDERGHGKGEPDAVQNLEQVGLRERKLEEQEQHQQRDAALALVVCAQDEHDVFDADDNGQRPDDERKHAHDVDVQQGNGVRAVEAFLDGIQRTGAHVALDHTKRRQGERHGPPLAVGVALCCGGLGAGQVA